MNGQQQILDAQEVIKLLSKVPFMVDEADIFALDITVQFTLLTVNHRG